MRKRLTQRKKEADQKKTAELTDPNQLGREDRVNPPLSKYETHKFVENHPLPDLKHDWQKDKRNEVGLPAPMKEAAVRQARQERDRLEKETKKKAEACLKIAEMILLEGDVNVQEDQAVDLMDLPTDAIVNTLRRKYELLENIEAAAKEATEDKEATEEQTEETKEAFGEEATDAELKEEETKEVEAEEKCAEEDEIEMSAAEEDEILDRIFTKETSEKKEVKKEGAKKLGNVKKASVDNDLSKLWKSDPDVSNAFGI